MFFSDCIFLKVTPHSPVMGVQARVTSQIHDPHTQLSLLLRCQFYVSEGYKISWRGQNDNYQKLSSSWEPVRGLCTVEELYENMAATYCRLDWLLAPDSVSRR